MKNAQMMDAHADVNGTDRNRKSFMKSSKRAVSFGSFVLVALLTAIPSQGQKKTTTYSTPTYTPAPQYHPVQQTQTRPATQPPSTTTQARPAQQQTRPATQSQPRPATQNQSQPAQPRYNPPASSSNRRTQNSSSTSRTSPRERERQQKEQETQRKEQARQQKQQETQNKEQARQQKEQQKRQEKEQSQRQKEQQKQQQKQQQERARLQKEQQKQLEKQQKEQARQQKELDKQHKNSNKTAQEPSGKSDSKSSSMSAAKGRADDAASARVMTPHESKDAVQRINSTRSGMTGVNRKPLPAGEVTLHSNGSMTLRANNGRQYAVRSNGTIASYGDREKTVSFDKSGKVQSVHTANLDISRGSHGQRTIVSQRADGTKLVSLGGHNGYVEHNVVVNNQTYIQRTMIVNRHAYASTFVASHYAGIAGVSYVPSVFFAPGFYGWAYYPWASPVSFAWGWYGAPWYMSPNPYFMASPMYPSAAFWLTDYAIGDTLATAYQLQADAMLDGDGSMADADMSVADFNEDAEPWEMIRAEVTTPISPEIKSAIADEVKQELANDNAEASNPNKANYDALPLALGTKNHVFVVANDLDVTTADEQTCALQAGDMLQLQEAAAEKSALVQLRVASSKRMDCPVGVLVSVSVSDLEDMQNSFQARVEAGLGELKNDQGRNGMPAAPRDAAAPPRPAVDGLSPASASDVSAALDQLRDQADQTEKQAVESIF